MSESAATLAIIPVYKQYEQRDRCVAALQKQTTPVDVFIHDNTVENLGFTKACNRGLRKALKEGYAFAMLINQDCYAEPPAVERLIQFMHDHPRCAIAAPMQASAENPDDIVNTGGLVAYPFGRHRAGGKRSAGAFAQSEQIAWANGACMFARLEAVVEFGLLDEGMFLIGSDSDWSLTARSRGWEVWYVADACVLHEGGVTNELPKTDVQRIFHNDMDYWRRKWAGTVTHRQLDRPPGAPRFAVPIAQAMQAATTDHGNGRLLEAEVIYRDVLALDPQNVDALNHLGILAMQNGLVLIGADLFAQAVRLSPGTAQLHVHYGAALSQLEKRQDDAVAQFCEAMRLEARSPQLLDTIAMELTKLARPAEAAAAREKATALRQPGRPV